MGGLAAFDLDRVLDFDPEFLKQDPSDHIHDDSVKSVACKFNGELNVNKLQMWIRQLIGNAERANDLFRYKGVLAVKGMEDKFVFQGVHMLFAGGFSDVQKWKKDEVRECRFVFIGRNLSRMDLEKNFMDCKVKDELRFKVGDIVEANANPYRLEIQNEDKTNIWGPVDDSKYVRAVGGE